MPDGTPNWWELRGMSDWLQRRWSPFRESPPIEISKGRGAEWRAAPPRKVIPRIGQPGYWSAMGIPAVEPKKVTPTTPTTEQGLMWYVPGLVLYDPKTKTYWDSDSQAQYSKQQADAIKTQYERQQEATDIQSLPVQAQWQLQELARTRKVLGAEANPFWAGLEQSIQERIGTGDITPEDLAMIERARKSEIASKFQAIGADIPEWGVTGAQSVMAERLRSQDRWRADQRQLLEGLPSGAEGDVARWFVGNMENPFSRVGQLGFEEAMAGQSTASRQLTAEAAGRKPMGPPTPGWLPEFVPGTTAGEPIGGRSGSGVVANPGWWQTNRPELLREGRTLPFVPTPSGQQLTKMTPSQAQWLSGAIDWFGGRPWKDILAEAEIMQPQTPRGAGQRQWRPSRQA